jgi:mRNA-degrading endonuclease toxin of MazEF toxin-antitoxin module
MGRYRDAGLGEGAGGVTRTAAPAWAEIHRGEIWLVSLDPASGSNVSTTRPVIVLSEDAVNRVRRTVVVVPVARAAGAYPPIIVAAGSVGEGCFAVCDQVRTVDQARLVWRQGSVEAAELRGIEAGMCAVLGL